MILMCVTSIKSVETESGASFIAPRTLATLAAAARIPVTEAIILSGSMVPYSV